jgi:hypothetical protein
MTGMHGQEAEAFRRGLSLNGVPIRKCAVVVLSGGMSQVPDTLVSGPYAAKTDNPADSAGLPVLYWSIRGEVACGDHAPPLDSPRWSQERWATMAPDVRARHGRRYQCQHCAGSKRPIAARQ